MEEAATFSTRPAICKHRNTGKYKERTFDIPNGFEITALRCRNCHTTLELTIRTTT